jgi:hypothetical protein
MSSLTRRIAARTSRALRLCGVTLVGLAVLSVPVGATSVGFSVGTGPAPGATELAPGGGYFAPTIAPGASYRSSVVIANSNHNAVSVRLYPVDGLTSPGSGTAYSNDGSALTGAGAWIAVSQHSLTLAPGSRTTDSFVVTVPGGSPSGDHLAGIAIEGTSPQVAKTKSNVQVNIVTRSVVGVLVTVPGPAQFAVMVGAPSIKLGTYKIGTVVIPLTDTGGLLGKPRLAVRLTKSSGYSRTVTRSLGTLLPGDSTSIEIFWPTKLAGRYTIKACAQGGGLAAPTCNTGSAVAPAAATTPSKNPGAFPLHSSAPASTATHSSPPTLLIVLVAVLGAIVLIGGSVLVGARLGRRKAAGAPPGEGAPRER